MGAARAQDTQTASTLVGLGGGVGGVGGVTGVTSLVQSNRTSKVLDEFHEEIKILHSKLNRAIEASITRDGEKNALAEQVTTSHAAIRNDLTEMGKKIDRIQSEVHNVALDVAQHLPFHNRHNRRQQDDIL